MASRFNSRCQLLQERDEPGLLEVSVVGQRLADVQILHQQKAPAIGQAPSLVRPRRVPAQRSLELGARLRYDRYVGIRYQATHYPSGALPEVGSPATHGSQELDEDHFSGDGPEGRQLLGDLPGFPIQ